MFGDDSGRLRAVLLRVFKRLHLVCWATHPQNNVLTPQSSQSLRENLIGPREKFIW